MKCFLPSEQWYLGQMPATFFPDFPALGEFCVESQVAFGGEARYRHDMSSEICFGALPGTGAWALWSSDTTCKERRLNLNFEDMAIADGICIGKETVMIFKDISWESLKFVSVSFEKCLNIAGNVSLSFPKLFLAFGRFEESHQDGHWHLARICKNMKGVLFSCTWLKSRFGWVFNAYVYLI